MEIRPAVATDAPEILRLIRALAEYEKLTHKVTATEDKLRQALFGPRPGVEALLACEGGRVVGFALFFHNFSTFLGSAGIYLEDLFVEPDCRGRGYGYRLLRSVAHLALERRCERLEWAVLDWNAPAIGFYKSLGAEPLDDWTLYRLTAEPLRKLGGS